MPPAAHPDEGNMPAAVLVSLLLLYLLVRTATALPVVTALPVSALYMLQHCACYNTVLVAATLSVPL
jgi:hypothetical protein